MVPSCVTLPLETLTSTSYFEPALQSWRNLSITLKAEEEEEEQEEQEEEKEQEEEEEEGGEEEEEEKEEEEEEEQQQQQQQEEEEEEEKEEEEEEQEEEEGKWEVRILKRTRTSTQRRRRKDEQTKRRTMRRRRRPREQMSKEENRSEMITNSFYLVQVLNYVAHIKNKSLSTEQRTHFVLERLRVGPSRQLIRGHFIIVQNKTKQNNAKHKKRAGDWKTA